MHKPKPKSSATEATPSAAGAEVAPGATPGAPSAAGATPSAAEVAPSTTGAPSAIIPPTSAISRYIVAIRRLKSFLHRYSPHNLVGQAKYDLSQLKRLNKWSYYYDPKFKPQPMKSSRLVNWVRRTMSNTRNAIQNLNRLNSLLMNKTVRKQIVKTSKLIAGITTDVLPDAAKEFDAAKTQAVNEVSTAAAQAGVAVLESVPGIQAPLTILSAADSISAAGEKIGNSADRLANITDVALTKIEDDINKLVPDIPEIPVPEIPVPVVVPKGRGGNRIRRSNRRTKKKGKYLKRNINFISSRRRRMQR